MLRFLKQKYPEKLLEVSGLLSREQSGRFFDRFRRRIMFPIANEGAKVIAFGGRAMGDDMPKYLNSPETPIYSKSNVLYHLDRAKEALRQNDFGVLVEGYMDAIAVARAGITNVIASCGTSLADPQIKLLGRFTRRVVVNYDPDTAGQAATERSLTLLLEKEFDVRVLALPRRLRSGQISKGTRRRSLQETVTAGSAVLGLFNWPRQTDGSNYCERASDGPQFSDAIRAALTKPAVAFGVGHAHRFRVACGRASLARSASPCRHRTSQRSEAESRTLRAERKGRRAPSNSHAWRKPTASVKNLLRKLFPAGCIEVLRPRRYSSLLIAKAGERSDPATFAEALDERDRRVLFEIFFESFSEHTWEEAESCLGVLRSRRVEQELAELQKQLESKPPTEELRRIITRRLELQKLLAGQ